MYERILVPVEHTEYDDVILQHVRKLARACNDASIVLIHVADGWAARNINQLDLRESEEMKSANESAIVESMNANFTASCLPSGVSSYCRVCTMEECR